VDRVVPGGRGDPAVAAAGVRRDLVARPPHRRGRGGAGRGAAMIDRRRFVRGAAATALVGGYALRGRDAAAQACAPLTAGAQLFTLRAELENPARVIADLAALGIEEVELFGLGPSSDRLFGRPDAELRGLLDAAGIRAPFAHVNDELEQPGAVGAIASRARTLGVETVV